MTPVSSPPKDIRILVIDDESTQCRMLAETLQHEGYVALPFTDPVEALARLSGEHFDILITDQRMQGMSGMECIQEAHRIDPDITAIIVTAYGTIETAVKAMKLGAFDFLTKPIDVEHLLLLLAKAEEQRQLIRENRLLKEQLLERQALPGIIGQSPAMQEVFSIIQRVAPTQATVLIRGESGTGKELVAKALHFHSPRRGRPLVAVHCAALPETLLESELFGHEKGAFTGAVRARDGKFQAAHGGTLFLDEIGEIAPSVQVKLLRFLQERSFERVGSNRPQQVDVRLVAATHRDLEQAIKDGSFREDLYYRLNVVTIRVPPLRERRRDLAALIDHFLLHYAKANHREIQGYTREFYDLLLRYDFPGNVRELENIVENAVVLSRGSHLTVADLPPALRTLSIEPTPSPVSDTEMLPDLLARIEKDRIVHALERHDYIQTRAAEALGIHERVLRYKMKKYGLETQHAKPR
jgi:DNA-binding NtrC family response regulator